MKNLILTYLPLIFLFASCETQKEDLISDQDKERIKSEIQMIFERIIENNEAGEEPPYQSFYNTPEFISVDGGKISNYNEFIKSNKVLFELIDNQIFNETTLVYTFINRETVILTYGATVIAKFNDDHQLMADPLAITLVFSKMDDSWKVMYLHESFQIASIADDSTVTE